MFRRNFPNYKLIGAYEGGAPVKDKDAESIHALENMGWMKTGTREIVSDERIELVETARPTGFGRTLYQKFLKR